MPASNTRKKNGRRNSAVSLYHFPPQARPILTRAVRAVFRARGRGGDVSLILVSDPEIRRLNRRFRKVNRITDVISFCYCPQPVQGDIYLARGRSRRQAKAQGHSWEKELAYLAVHGVLHLFGYTDYTPAARAKMFRLQDKIWETLQESRRRLP